MLGGSWKVEFVRRVLADPSVAAVGQVFQELAPSATGQSRFNIAKPDAHGRFPGFHRDAFGDWVQEYPDGLVDPFRDIGPVDNEALGVPLDQAGFSVRIYMRYGLLVVLWFWTSELFAEVLRTEGYLKPLLRYLPRSPDWIEAGR